MLEYVRRIYTSVKPVLEFITFAAALFELLRYGFPYFASKIPELQPTFPRALQSALIVHTAVLFILVVCLGGIPRSQKRPEYKDALAASCSCATLSWLFPPRLGTDSNFFPLSCAWWLSAQS